MNNSQQKKSKTSARFMQVVFVVAIVVLMTLYLFTILQFEETKTSSTTNNHHNSGIVINSHYEIDKIHPFKINVDNEEVHNNNNNAKSVLENKLEHEKFNNQEIESKPHHAVQINPPEKKNSYEKYLQINNHNNQNDINDDNKNNNKQVQELVISNKPEPKLPPKTQSKPVLHDKQDSIIQFEEEPILVIIDKPNIENPKPTNTHILPIDNQNNVVQKQEENKNQFETNNNELIDPIIVNNQQEELKKEVMNEIENLIENEKIDMIEEIPEKKMPKPEPPPLNKFLKDVKIKYPPFFIDFPNFINFETENWYLNYYGIQDMVNIAKSSMDNPQVKNDPTIGLSYVYSDLEEERYLSQSTYSKKLEINNKIGMIPMRSGKRSFLYGTPKHTEGTISFYENAVVTSKDCGWGSKFPQFEPNPDGAEYISGLVVFAHVPDGLYFQHFIDGVLPKIVQLMLVKPEQFPFEYNKDTKIKLAFQGSPRHSIVSDLIKQLGFETVYFRNSKIRCQYLLNFCHTPVLQSVLWQNAVSSIYSSVNITSFYDNLYSYEYEDDQVIIRENLNSEVTLHLDLPEKRYIAYMSRSLGGTFNGGRHVTNEEKILEIVRSHLANFYPNVELVMYVHSNFKTLEENLRFLSKVKVMMGPHGGALTNIIFTPPDCTLVEFFMTNDNGVSQLRHPGMMMYIQSGLVRHPYYVLRSKILDSQSNMLVNEDQVRDVMWQIFPPVTNDNENVIYE